MGQNSSINSGSTSPGNNLLVCNGVAPPSFQNLGVGGMRKLATYTANNTSLNIDMTSVLDSSLYVAYVIEAFNVSLATNTALLRMTVSQNNGGAWGSANYLSTTSFYQLTSAPASNVGSGSTTLGMTILTATDSSGIASFRTYVQPNSAGYLTMSSKAIFKSSALTAYATLLTCGTYNPTGAIPNALRLQSSSGNINTGTFVLYGVTL